MSVTLTGREQNEVSRRKRAPNAAPSGQAMFQQSTIPTLSEMQYQKLRSKIVSL